MGKRDGLFPNPKDVPTDIRLRKGTRTLRTWLHLIDQKAKTAKEWQQDWERYGTILRYMGRPRVIDPGWLKHYVASQAVC